MLETEGQEHELVCGPPTDWIFDGETIDCGGLCLTAHTTPGHIRGHTVFETADGSLLFTGDHVLPRITPTLGFEYSPEGSPLTSYLESLHKLADGPAIRMLPAHGHTQGEASNRARELLAHHEQRLVLVLQP